MGLPAQTYRTTLPEGALVAWRPQSGPQSALLACPFDEIFFGGARGGGKTDGMLGEWAQHAAMHGRYAIGVFFRKTLTQLEEAIERAKQIYEPIGAVYKTQAKTFIMPGGARLKFRSLERDDDAQKYQGHSYCVGVGTLIRMGDGSLKSIEKIKKGEYVATLSGPRKVLATVEPYQAPCVKALVRGVDGAVRGEQIHPVWHPVLTTAGLTSSHKPSKRHIDAQSRNEKRDACRHPQESHHETDQDIPAWFAFSEDGRNDYRASSRSHREAQPSRELTVPVVLYEHSHRPPQLKHNRDVSRHESNQSRSQHKSGAPSSDLHLGLKRSFPGLPLLIAHAQLMLDHFFPAPPSAASCGRLDWNRLQDYPGDYPCEYDFYDEQFRLKAEIYPADTQPQDDAESTRHASPSDASGTTREHSQKAQQSWEHPYTGEAFDLEEAASSGTMELTRVGPYMVADLCVDEVNHYITDSGLINKNTRIYFEELTNWANPSPINKLRATLRNAHAGVDTKFMATGNPGGPGHQWVKARYIDPQPNGYLPLEETMTVPGVDPETMMIRDIQITTTRVFIPSKLQDNKLLMLNDPGYVANLHLAGSEELVRAWLDGDWDVIDGAYFDEFRKERHIMTRIDLPAYLQRFRSFDWGSAKPFSCGFWAVSDGTIEHPDHGYLIPRGALIRYREWYGQKKGQPNVGLKLTAEDVARGIVKRSEGFNFSNDVSDPAAFAQDGGPSIAERMYTATHGALPFYRADNKRIPGWDQLRWRLKGNEDGIPMIYFMDTCLATIRTLPALQHDEHNAEDVDTASEDHAPDEIRYACMSRPITKPKPKEKPPMGTVQDLTMDELWDTTSNNSKKTDRI